nr:eukaryotic translation initiation factor 2D isoform X2 [Leptinotarsa decemlineata]
MFKKPFKIKTNTQSKATERKNFKDTLLRKFPNLTESEVNDLLPKKEALNVVKIVTHSNVVVNVYTVQKRPVIFEVEGNIFPTVFLLWKFPHLLYSFTTHQQVMSFISSGADLMLPGVVTPPSHSGLPKYGSVSENDIVYINMSHNKAAIAVGLASQSSAAMLQESSRGKCVNIYHFYGDNLCTLEGMPNCPIPILGPPEWLQLKSFDEDFPALGVSQKQLSPSGDEKQLLPVEDEKDKPTNSAKQEPETEVEIVDSVDDMDNLLCYCFLGAIKYTKNLTLPVLTSNFFKLHMLPLCPSDKTLDIKKTSYKKLKPFLKKMTEDGLITVKEIKGGVEAIIAINRDHPKLQEFYITPSDRPKKETEEIATATNVVESYLITDNVLPIFEGCRKGDTVQPSDVRRHVTNYVKENNLQDESNNRLVKPKNILATICKTEHSVTWEEVIEKVCASMKNCYKVKSGNEEILNKGKVSPITISVVTRSGNKKVTLVDNLELFGVRLNEFAKECQHGVAASTSISRPLGKKYDQLLVQGNQVLFVYNLLVG